ncbi:MAG: LapA family protein [Dechloromonas sp.]|nr:MAG: LapA family protein [Dechloromonas sp.]
MNVMTALTWAIRLVIFSFLVVFAVQNTDPVSLHFVLDHVWQAPLVIVLLAFFAGGAVLGVLSVLGVIYRQRREISRLRQLAGKLPNESLPDTPPAL